MVGAVSVGVVLPKGAAAHCLCVRWLHFALRGIQEQYDLVPSQLVRIPSSILVYDHSVYYEYVEFISKDNQHRFKDINSTNKCVPMPSQEVIVVL